MLAYRYLSESLAGELNRGEREAGAVDFDYARQDECLEGQDRLNFVQNRGYYIEPGLLFENVMQYGEDELNIRLDKALRQIEASGEAFLALVQQVYDDVVDGVVKELNLRDGAREFIGRCVEAGQVLEVGSGLDAILPPVRRFGGGGHGAVREKAIVAIQGVVNEFEGIVI